MKKYKIEFCFTSGYKDIHEDWNQENVDNIRTHIKEEGWSGSTIREKENGDKIFINFESLERIFITPIEE